MLVTVGGLPSRKKDEGAVLPGDLVSSWQREVSGREPAEMHAMECKSSAIGEKNLDWVVENQGYQLRHDAFGSKYYGEFERGYADKYKTRRMIVAESCYWFVNTDYGAAMSGEYDFTEQWRSDETYNPRARSWRDVYKRTYEEALEARANMLDLREEREAESWIRQGFDVVDDFINNGGYRLSPVAVSFPSVVKIGKDYTIGHAWRNSGYGVCPNFDRRWGCPSRGL